MIRARRLQTKDENGTWTDEAYAIESPSGQVIFHYPFWWEHIGGQYAYEIQQTNMPLEQVAQIVRGPKLKWLPVERLEMTYAQAIDFLDAECQIPRAKKKTLAPTV